jgi:VanZ family protein
VNEPASEPVPEAAGAPLRPLLATAAAPSFTRLILPWLPAVLYTALIWFLSSQTLDFKLMEDVPMRDKGVHFVEYGALGFFLAHACHATWPRLLKRYVLALWLTAALGLVDELHQLYVPGRSADAADLVADVLGGMLAIVGYAGIRAWHGRSRPAPSSA